MVSSTYLPELCITRQEWKRHTYSLILSLIRSVTYLSRLSPRRRLCITLRLTHTRTHARPSLPSEMRGKIKMHLVSLTHRSDRTVKLMPTHQTIRKYKKRMAVENQTPLTLCPQNSFKKGFILSLRQTRDSKLFSENTFTS